MKRYPHVKGFLDKNDKICMKINDLLNCSTEIIGNFLIVENALFFHRCNL